MASCDLTDATHHMFTFDHRSNVNVDRSTKWPPRWPAPMESARRFAHWTHADTSRMYGLEFAAPVHLYNYVYHDLDARMCLRARLIDYDECMLSTLRRASERRYKIAEICRYKTNWRGPRVGCCCYSGEKHDVNFEKRIISTSVGRLIGFRCTSRVFCRVLNLTLLNLQMVRDIVHHRWWILGAGEWRLLTVNLFTATSETRRITLEFVQCIWKWLFYKMAYLERFVSLTGNPIWRPKHRKYTNKTNRRSSKLLDQIQTK